MEKKSSCVKWLEIFSNFRNGSVMTEIIKNEEPFIREPYWFSPLYRDDFRLYRTFEIEGIKKPADYPLEGDGTLWDGICKDDVARKFLFIRAVDSPEDLKGSCGDISAEEKAAMEKVFRMLNLDGDINSWFDEYYPVAKELTEVALVGDPLSGALERGYRAELLILNLIGNFLGDQTTKEEWDAFLKEMIDKMFGPRGIPYVVFTIPFEV